MHYQHSGLFLVRRSIDRCPELLARQILASEVSRASARGLRARGSLEWLVNQAISGTECSVRCWRNCTRGPEARRRNQACRQRRKVYSEHLRRPRAPPGGVRGTALPWESVILRRIAAVASRRSAGRHAWSARTCVAGVGGGRHRRVGSSAGVPARRGRAGVRQRSRRGGVAHGQQRCAARHRPWRCRRVGSRGPGHLALLMIGVVLLGDPVVEQFDALRTGTAQCASGHLAVAQLRTPSGCGFCSGGIALTPVSNGHVWPGWLAAPSARSAARC